jgi:hypothetical protein
MMQEVNRLLLIVLWRGMVTARYPEKQRDEKDE